MQTILGNYPEETCLVWGASLDELPFLEDSKEARQSKRQIHFSIMSAIESGYTHFVVVPSFGTGLWAAECVAALMQTMPFLELTILEGELTQMEMHMDDEEAEALDARYALLDEQASNLFDEDGETFVDTSQLLALLEPRLVLHFGQHDAWMEIERADPSAKQRIEAMRYKRY